MLGSLERSREAQHRLVADASHELRTPLTALQGNVAYLARHGATPELVADLQEGTDRLVRLAGDLIAISREEAAAPPADDVALDRLVASLADGRPAASCVDCRAGRACEATEPRSSGRSRTCRRTRAPRAGGRSDHAHRAAVGRPGARLRLRRGAGSRPCRPGAGVRAFLAWRSRPLRAPGLGLAIVRATAERHGGQGVRRRFLLHDRAPGSQRTLQLRCYTGGGTLRGRIAMRYLRTLPTARLLGLSALVIALFVAAAVVAVAASGGGGADAAAEAARRGRSRRAHRSAGRRCHRARDLHEQAVSVRGAPRQRRPGADVRAARGGCG